MLISALSIKEEKKEASGRVKTRKYLQIETDAGQKVDIDLDEYEALLAESLAKVAVTPERSVAVTPQMVTVSADILAPKMAKTGIDNDQMLKFILEKIDVKKAVKTAEDSKKFKELVVRSELREILDLPWEKITKTLCVIREVPIKDSASAVTGSNNNFLFIKSHAHIIAPRDGGDSQKLHNISSEINDEIKAILEHLVSNSRPSFKSDNLHLLILKHATHENMTNLDWDRFNFVHMAMHGEPGGLLCLEDDTVYDIVSYISKQDLITLVKAKQKNKFTLVFLSSCYSGVDTSTSSMAFDFISEGLSLYTIGYYGKAGSGPAVDFTKNFYDGLFYGKDARLSFLDAFEVYKTKNPGLEYTPVFYTSVK